MTTLRGAIGYPDERAPLLSFHGGRFRSVFCCLSPFTRDEAPVTWAEVAAGAGFNDVIEVNVALRTGIGGLQTEFERKDLYQRLFDYSDATGLSWPDEGSFDPASSTRLIECLRRRDVPRVRVESEFGDESRLEAPGLASFDRFAHPRIANEDGSIVFTVHWDNHFFLAFSDDLALPAQLRDLGVEGFVPRSSDAHASLLVPWSPR